MSLRNACLLFFFCACLFIGPAYAAEIQVSVDRNPVNLNESFQIIFSSSEQPDGNPDFTPLEADFEILNQQRSSNVSWINGQSSRSERWIVSVMAKHSGDLLIPPIAFGADSSQPLTVKVTDKPQNINSDDEIFLDVQATPEHPYVQSQVLYTLKIYFRVQISQSRLSDLSVQDAIVEQLGEDATYRTQINGVEYGVLERKYAIFPQQSGLFTIAPLTLTTEVVSGRQPRFNGFFSRQLTETRRISSKAITLDVQPVPQNFTGTAWLSAESLQLSEDWSEPRLKVKIGEPLTRTLRVSAKGTTVGQLPELAGQTGIEGLKTYPDQPVLNETKQGDGLVASREEKIAYIPNQAGDYTLPEVTITWFNTKTQKTEVATLPEVTIHALAPAGSTQSSSPEMSESPAQAQTTPALPEQLGPGPGLWQGLSAFFAAGWLTTLLWFYLKSKTARTNKPTIEILSNLYDDKALKAACRRNDPQAAKQALLQWGKQRFDVDNLAWLADHCASPLSDEILRLNQCLYANTQQTWHGQALWHAYSKYADAAQKTEPKQDTALEPLYRL